MNKFILQKKTKKHMHAISKAIQWKEFAVLVGILGFADFSRPFIKVKITSNLKITNM